MKDTLHFAGVKRLGRRSFLAVGSSRTYLERSGEASWSERVSGGRENSLGRRVEKKSS